MLSEHLLPKADYSMEECYPSQCGKEHIFRRQWTNETSFDNKKCSTLLLRN